jgi:hypothetical protein
MVFDVLKYLLLVESYLVGDKRKVKHYAYHLYNVHRKSVSIKKNMWATRSLPQRNGIFTAILL